MNPAWIAAAWPAPKGVRAFTTTRTGGISSGPWATLNLGTNTGDEAAQIQANRARLARHLPAQPQWLRQVHGRIVREHGGAVTAAEEGDALVAFAHGRVCAVLTADCLPVFLCSREGDRVAVAHAGWRGLAAGILPETVHALDREPSRLLAWLGPAIGPRAYEVGAEVEGVLAGIEPAAFRRHGNKWLLDLYRVARTQLQRAGVKRVFGGDLCTFSDPERFYSYRRDGETGRMASVIWLEDS
jgi:YfiH family protein